MEARIQNLAEESISKLAWKFDDNIKKAFHAIHDRFVKSTQTALNDAHKHDQEDFKCFTASERATVITRRLWLNAMPLSTSAMDWDLHTTKAVSKSMATTRS